MGTFVTSVRFDASPMDEAVRNGDSKPQTDRTTDPPSRGGVDEAELRPDHPCPADVPSRAATEGPYEASLRPGFDAPRRRARSCDVLISDIRPAFVRCAPPCTARRSAAASPSDHSSDASIDAAYTRTRPGITPRSPDAPLRRSCEYQGMNLFLLCPRCTHGAVADTIRPRPAYHPPMHADSISACSCEKLAFQPITATHSMHARRTCSYERLLIGWIPGTHRCASARSCIRSRFDSAVKSVADAPSRGQL